MVNQQSTLQTIPIGRINSLTHLKCMIILANANGVLNDEAMEFLTKRMDLQNLTINDFNQASAELLKEGILPKPVNSLEHLPAVSTKKMSVAIQCLQDYVSIMCCDNKIDANEKILSYAFATKMGLSQSMVDMAIQMYLKASEDNNILVDNITINIEEMLKKQAEIERTKIEEENNKKAKAREIELQNRADKGELRGWLLVFLLCSGLGAVLTIFLNIYYTDFTQDYVGFGWFFFADFSIYLSHAAVCLYMIDGFYKKRDNTIFWGKVMLFAYLLSNCIMLFVNDFPNRWVHNIWGCIFALVWGTIWYTYLSKSKQVARLIPYERRAPSKKDWTLLACMAALPILACSAGVITIVTNPIETQVQDERIIELSSNTYRLKHMTIAFPEKYTTRISMDGEGIIFRNVEDGVTGNFSEGQIYPFYSVSEKMERDVFPDIKKGLEKNVYFISRNEISKDSVYSHEFNLVTFDHSKILYGVLMAKKVDKINYAMVYYNSVYSVNNSQRDIEELFNSITLNH